MKEASLKKAIYCRIPTVWHSGKGKIMETVKRSVVARVEGRVVWVDGAEEIFRTANPFCGGSDGRESACNAGDPGSIPELGWCPGEANGNPLSILAWRTPWMEEPGGLQSMELQRAGYNWVTFTSLQSAFHGTTTLGLWLFACFKCYFASLPTRAAPFGQSMHFQSGFQLWITSLQIMVTLLSLYFPPCVQVSMPLFSCPILHRYIDIWDCMFCSLPPVQ